MTERQVFSFPWLHPKVGGHPVPEYVLWLDPGVDLPGESRRYRPEDMPFSAQEVRRLLREYQQFGERFAKPADMRTYQAVGLENFYTDTTMDILSDLRGGAVAEQPDPLERRKQAQLVLAMALSREEQFVAMLEQSARFTRAREGFAAVLGLEEDDESFVDQGVSDDVIVPRAHVDLLWKSVVPSFLTILPPQAELFIADPEIVREVRACGVEFSPADAGTARGLLDATHVERLCGVTVDVLAPISVHIPESVEEF